MSPKRALDVLEGTAQVQPPKRVRVERTLQHGPSTPQSPVAEHSIEDYQIDSTVMNEADDNVPPRASLLGMPREIRNLIYSYIFPSIVPRGKTPTWLAAPHPVIPCPSQKIKRGSIFRLGGIPISPVWWYIQKQKYRCAPLQINHQLRNEIFPVFLRDGYVHSWERRTDMPATAAWLHGLPKEQLELVRAISVNLRGEFDNHGRPALWAPVLPKSQESRITLYYFQNDHYLDMVFQKCSRRSSFEDACYYLEISLMSGPWQYWHMRDRYVNAGGNGDKYDSEGDSNDERDADGDKEDSGDEDVEVDFGVGDHHGTESEEEYHGEEEHYDEDEEDEEEGDGGHRAPQSAQVAPGA